MILPAQLSIVIPTYNNATFLPRCLDSIFNQSVKDIHVFLVNDGSTDDTIQIINYYKRKYSNLFVINHQYNMGTGIARNSGISAVDTPLIAFLDSDDWIDTNAYLEMINSLKNTETEIAICGIRTEYSNRTCSTIRYSYPYKNVVTGHFALKLLSKIEQQDIFISPMIGNKIFSTNFILKNKLKFPDSSLYEDDEFMFLAFCYAKNVSLVPNVYQHYFQRETSITHTFDINNIKCLIQIFQNIRNRLNKENLFKMYQREYFAFLDKCLSGLLDTLFACEQNINTQRKYITFLLEELLKIFSIQELILYIEPHRLQRLWQ